MMCIDVTSEEQSRVGRAGKHEIYFSTGNSIGQSDARVRTCIPNFHSNLAIN